MLLYHLADVVVHCNKQVMPLLIGKHSVGKLMDDQSKDGSILSTGYQVFDQVKCGTHVCMNFAMFSIEFKHILMRYT